MFYRIGPWSKLVSTRRSTVLTLPLQLGFPDFRFRKRWPEPENSESCHRCDRKISTRYTGQARSGTRRVRNKITDRIKIYRIGSNGSRLVLSDFNPKRDSGVYRCFAHRVAESSGNLAGNTEPIFIEAEVRALKIWKAKLLHWKGI
jgi:hypothetical protein